jgi:hypothetical protein
MMILGKNSGITTGSVIEDSAGYTVGGIYLREHAEATYSSQGGDSGAPVVSGSSLVGFHSAEGGVFARSNNVSYYYSGLTWGF